MDMTKCPHEPPGRVICVEIVASLEAVKSFQNNAERQENQQAQPASQQMATL